MFSKLCKNTIFPSLSSSTSNNPNNTPEHNNYHLSSNSISHHQVNSNRRTHSASNHRNQHQQHRHHHQISSHRRREPPPPYSAHYNHEPIPQSRRSVPTHFDAIENDNSSNHDNRTQRSDNSNEERNLIAGNRRDNRERSADNDDGNHEAIVPAQNVFCPDLVSTCVGILSIDNESDQNYVEIGTALSNLSINSHSQNIHLQRSDGCSTVSVVAPSEEEVMGQNLSLRRPRISLTWVLREHSAQTQSTTAQQQLLQSGSLAGDSSKGAKKVAAPDWNSIKTVDRAQSKSRARSKEPAERLFNEKYVSEHNLIEYNNVKKIQYDKNSTILATCVGGDIKQNTFRKSNRSQKSEKYRKLPKNSSDLDKNQLNVNVKNNHRPADLCKTTSVPTLLKPTTGSELSVFTLTTDGQKRHRRHRRRERERGQNRRFGYEIKNVDDFLAKCSLASPANIPVVLSSASMLYQTRPGGYQIEIPLQLGMVVNAVFKNQNWLYVQTPHAEEGYINYDSCLPLGILPANQRPSSTCRPPPCWETNGDIFPNPCGNMTDSEKELRLRSGTRSEGRRTPRLKRNNQTCSEKNLDTLYLRAASQPKMVDQSYAQLKPTNKCKSSLDQNFDHFDKTNGDYVVLQQRANHQQLSSQKPNLEKSFSKSSSVRQTLLAITEDFRSDMIGVTKGDVVTLVACKEYLEKGSSNYKQWFFIRNREGHEGYIPAEVAGHGFL